MMKLLITAAAAMMLLAAPAMAQNASQSGSISQSAAVVQQNSTTALQAPGIGAPGIAVSIGTCLGSSSGGISGPGFGIAFGGSQEDKACQARQDAIVFAQLGRRDIALIRMVCGNPESAAAAAAAGAPCPLAAQPTRRASLFGGSTAKPVAQQAAPKPRGARVYNADKNVWE